MPGTPQYAFCPVCGGRLENRRMNDRSRLTCQDCHFIFYQNPIVGVAAIVFNQDGHLLLGRRTGGTYQGKWCIPCGYLEYDEDIIDGVKREFKEETNLDIEIDQVFSVLSNFHDPSRHTVGVWFLAAIVGGSLQAGDDLDDVQFFPLDKIPQLAFPTDNTVINMIKIEHKRLSG